jgi:hypothetical protein
MRRVGSLLLAVVVLAGCGDFQMLDPDGGTPTPTPSPLPEGVAQIRFDRETPMDAGRYSDRAFEPRVTFEIEGDTWYVMQRERGFFDIEQGIEDTDHVIAVQFARPTRLWGSGAEEPADAADAVAILERNPDLEIVETDTSQIGGLEGSQVTIQYTGEEHTNFMSLPPGVIAINSGRRLWIAFFDTPAGVLAVMVGGSIERWDEALAAAEPVLESITIGTGDASS